MSDFRFGNSGQCLRGVDNEIATLRAQLAESERLREELVEAVAWERECEDVAHWRYEVWEMAPVGSGDCEIYTVAECLHDAARAEVGRLIATTDCKGEG